MNSSEHPGGVTGSVITSALEHLSDLDVRAAWKSNAPIDGSIDTGALLIDTITGRHEFPAVASATISSASLTLLPMMSRRFS